MQKKSYIVYSLLILGIIYHSLGNIEDSFEYLNQSLDLANQLNHFSSKIYALNALGFVYFSKRDSV